MIASAPSNTRRRNAIRSTWGRPSTEQSRRFSQGKSTTTVLPVFLVGECEHPSQARLIRKEAQEYGDMLVGTYLDSYRNLTLKTVHGFLWVADHIRPSFVLKTDDDCFVNVDILLDVLAETVVFQSEPVVTGVVRKNSASAVPSGDVDIREQVVTPPSRVKSATRLPSPLYVGNVRWNNQVVRNPRNRWFVSEKDYARSQYPPYGSGAGYVLDARALDVLTRNVRRVRPFANEDAYVGTVLSEAGVRPVQSYRFVSQPSGLWTCNFLYVVVVHGVSPEDHDKFLAKVRTARGECRDVERDIGWD
ncbi:hypothetical protein HPB52_012728 [Rhipicephalus sanguineus]|uniref:Hexosyltransferase n=2 Tax=Rhipicephalus sanguineus TaxID=34632 RepID=A0A9D4QA06_RHISA|nr:hypothetical protein HPB52_012728 [Rhipicephalus sanguineus]